MTTEEAYRLYFRKLSRFVEFLKTVIAEYKSELPALPQTVESQKQGYLKFFAQPKAVSLCSGCGQCCYQNRSYLSTIDLIRVIMANPNFNLPKPDYRFLKIGTRQIQAPPDATRNYTSGGYKCIFLGLTGCQLKENRPRTCYEWACSRLREVLKNEWGKFDQKHHPAICDNNYYQWEQSIELRFKDLLKDIEKKIAEKNFLSDFAESEKQEFLKALQLFTAFEEYFDGTEDTLGFGRAPAYSYNRYGLYNPIRGQPR